MSNFTTELDKSILHFLSSPKFVSIGIANCENMGEAEFVHDLENAFESYSKELETWSSDCLRHMQQLETMLVHASAKLDHVQTDRLLGLSTAVRERAFNSASIYAGLIGRLKHRGAAYGQFSTRFLRGRTQYAARLDAMLAAELHFLMDVSDHYRAMARQFGPEGGQGKMFNDAASALAYLNSD